MAAAPAVCRFGSFICCAKLRLYFWPEAKFSTITLNAFASFFAATLASICNARLAALGAGHGNDELSCKEFKDSE